MRKDIGVEEEANHLPRELRDNYGRTVRYLRVSVTDRCNLCCRYCRTRDVPFIEHQKILRFEEIEEIIRLAVEFGVQKLRLTGGEPFVRKGFMGFLKKLRLCFPQLTLKLTTNGTLISPYLNAIKDLGISVNLSLDSLDRDNFAFITRRDMLHTVMDNLRHMLELDIPLKINVVAMHGVNETELPALASLAMDHPVDVRFIEFMPIGDENIWSRNTFWPAARILETVREHWCLEDVQESVEGGAAMERGPAKLWKLRARDGRLSQGHFGLITSVSQSFCRSCNRLRLTADGHLRACLFDDREYSIRDVLRNNGPEAVARIMVKAVANKPIGAEILAARRGPVASKSMSAIGG